MSSIGVQPCRTERRNYVATRSQKRRHHVEDRSRIAEMLEGVFADYHVSLLSCRLRKGAAIKHTNSRCMLPSDLQFGLSDVQPNYPRRAAPTATTWNIKLFRHEPLPDFSIVMGIINSFSSMNNKNSHTDLACMKAYMK